MAASVWRDILTSAAACSSKRSAAASAGVFGTAGSGETTGVALGNVENSLVSLHDHQVSPSLRFAHLPHCTHRCRPETRDGLSTSRLGRSGIAGCRAALRSGESLKLSFEGKRVPARRASGAGEPRIQALAAA